MNVLAARLDGLRPRGDPSRLGVQGRGGGRSRRRGKRSAGRRWAIVVVLGVDGVDRVVGCAVDFSVKTREVKLLIQSGDSGGMRRTL